MSVTSIDFQSLHLQKALASPGYVIGVSAILLTVYCAGKIIYNIFFHPLSKYPGPKRYAATFIPQCWLWFRGTEHDTLKELHNKYGEVVRIAPDSLSYTGAQAWKDIYGYRPGMRQVPKDGMFYKRSGKAQSSDIIYSNDVDHSRFRRTLANAFSDKALRGSEPILSSYFDLLISSLKKRASSPETSTVDLMAWYNWTTFDIIGDLAFGEPFHALSDAAYHPYISSMFSNFAISRLFRIFRYYNLENVVLDMVKFASHWNTGSKKTLNNLNRSYAVDIISKRLSPEKKMQDRQDFMYHILRQEESKGMSREELDLTASVLVVAGSETTATFLSGTTYNLLKHPDVLQTLTNEVRNRFKSADEITLASTIASEMPYLHATIEEGLRMYPPVPSRLPRRTTEGIIINGEYVPPNTAIGVHQLSSSHNEAYYHNANQFVPDRWLASPPAAYRNDKLDSNNPFSIGPRNCLGKNLAYGEMRCILARMVWHFDMSLAKEEAKGHEWNKQKIYTLWIKGPLWVNLKLREGITV